MAKKDAETDKHQDDFTDKDASIPESTERDLEASTDEEETEQAQIEDLHEDKPTDDEPDGVKVDPATAPGGKRPNAWHRFWHWAKTHKKVSIPLAVVLVLGIWLAIPYTRFMVAGLFMKQDYKVVVLDQTTGKPVSAATVLLNDQKASTDGQGKASLHVPVGYEKLTVKKSYYQTTEQNVSVPILDQKEPYTVRIKATGRQVPITVVNKISGKPLKGVLIRSGDSEAKTNSEGQAVLVVPTGKASVSAELSGEGLNKAVATVKVTTEADPANKFTMTPSGKLYFLSNASGKIDVVKSNLDGTERAVVLAGTGNEDKQNTLLLATTDWKYLALLSKRDGGEYAKLFLIDTASDKVTTMDEGKAEFSLVGWRGHHFVYNVRRVEVKEWQPGRQALKSFNAETGQLATLDQTAAEGADWSYIGQFFSDFYIIEDKAVYTVQWYGSSTSVLAGKNNSIRTVDVSGANKKDVKTFVANDVGYMQTTSYEPNSVYYRVSQNYGATKQTYYEYEDGAIKEVQLADDQFYQAYPTYLFSPSGGKTFWSELRDGKNALFVGDKDGKNGTQIANLSEHAPYGWYTDEYLLTSKNSSELYILPAAGGTPLKMTDYYKPALTIRGYGGGYGGL